MTDKQHERELLAKNIDKLEIDGRTKAILEYRYGGLDKMHTLEETGKRFGLSKQRIDQIIKRVLKLIK